MLQPKCSCSGSSAAPAINEPAPGSASGVSAPAIVQQTQLQRLYGNRYVQRLIAKARREADEQGVMRDGETTFARERGDAGADAASTEAATAERRLVRKEARGGNMIQRFAGKVDFIKRYEIEGDISGGLFATPIIGVANNAYILAGSSGKLTINLKGKAIGETSGFIKGGIVGLSFSLDDQKIPYKCTPEGELTIETAAISPGHTTYDSSQLTNPVGSDIGVSIGTSVDAASSPKFLIEQLSFAVGGGGIQVSVSKGPVSVGGPTLGGSGSETTSLPIRFNFQIIGQRPASKPAAPPTSTTATAGASASASATITGAAPATVPVPSPHSIYFANEEQTVGDEGELVRWAASLPTATQGAIRTGRLTTTAIGYASTTGTDRANFEGYSRLRAEWVRGVLAHALGVDVKTLHVGWRGSYTAPPADRSHPGGVANPHERRVDISFAETAPMTPVSVTAASSASSSATAHSGS